MMSYENTSLAGNMDDLKLLAKPPKALTTIKKFDLICGSLNKLYKSVQQNPIDQERNYIFLTRYLYLYDKLLNSRQSDRIFVELRFGNEYKKAKTQYEQITNSLNEWYKLMNRNLQSNNKLTPTITTTDVVEKESKSKSTKIFNSDFITCSQLYSALQKQLNMLIVDARPKMDYELSRINISNIINIPDEYITPGLSANALGKLLPIETQTIWDKRDSFSVIVLLDRATNSDNFSYTKLQNLYSALVDWDFNKNYNESPTSVNGGYLEFIEKYPTLCTNSLIILTQRNGQLDDILNLDNITYPDVSNNIEPPIRRIKEIKEELVPFEMNNKEEIEIQPEMVEFEFVNCNGQQADGYELIEEDNQLINQSDDNEQIEMKVQPIKIDDDDSVLSKTISDSDCQKTIEIPKINRSTKPKEIPKKFLYFPTLKDMGLGLIGLRNIRNICYMNSIIQSFAHIPSIKNLFCTDELNKYKIIDSNKLLIIELLNVIRIIWSNQHIQSFYMKELYTKIISLVPNYGDGAHEDATEFFIFLLDKLIDESIYQIDNAYLSALTPKQKAWHELIRGRYSVFTDDFYHQILVKQICKKCGIITPRYEGDSMVMVPIPTGTCTLQDKINEYLKDFKMNEICCAKCKRPLLNQKEVSYHPKILFVIIKRTNFVNADVEKNTNEVRFPINGLKFGNFSYDLCSFVLHKGKPKQGHYIAIANTPKGWHVFNDDSVYPLNYDDVTINREVYCLFYSRNVEYL